MIQSVQEKVPNAAIRFWIGLVEDRYRTLGEASDAFGISTRTLRYDVALLLSSGLIAKQRDLSDKRRRLLVPLPHPDLKPHVSPEHLARAEEKTRMAGIDKEMIARLQTKALRIGDGRKLNSLKALRDGRTFHSVYAVIYGEKTDTTPDAPTRSRVARASRMAAELIGKGIDRPLWDGYLRFVFKTWKDKGHEAAPPLHVVGSQIFREAFAEEHLGKRVIDPIPLATLMLAAELPAWDSPMLLEAVRVGRKGFVAGEVWGVARNVVKLFADELYAGKPLPMTWSKLAKPRWDAFVEEHRDALKRLDDDFARLHPEPDDWWEKFEVEWDPAEAARKKCEREAAIAKAVAEARPRVRLLRLVESD